MLEARTPLLGGLGRLNSGGLAQLQVAVTLSVAGLFACTSGTPDKPREGPVIVEQAAVPEQPVEPVPTPAPAPAPHPEPPPGCTPTPLAKGALEFVRAKPLDMPTHIDPSGRFGAQEGQRTHPAVAPAEGDGSCEVWELDSGAFLGDFGSERASGACWPGAVIPCQSWPRVEALEMHPTTPAVAVQRFAKNEDISVVAEGCAGRGFVGMQTRFRFECATSGAKAEGDRFYVALSLSPDKQRFVVARLDALELRSLTDGELIAELSLTKPKPPARELFELGLAWSARGMPVAVSKRGPVCDDTDLDACKLERWNEDEFIWELRRWDGPDAPVQATVLNWGDDPPGPYYLRELTLDPVGLWLFAEGDGGYEHDVPWARAQLPLTPEAAARSFDVSGEWPEGENVYTKAEPWASVGSNVTVDATWLGGARTVRVWSLANSEYDGEGGGSDDLYWASFELTPATTRRSGPHELASDYHVETHSLAVLGVGEGEGVVAWSHCFADDDPTGLGDYDDIGPDNCRGRSPIPPDCEARGTSAELDWLLLACEEGWRLKALAGAAAEAFAEVELGSTADGPITAVYGRSGLAVASERGGAKLLRPNGELRALLKDVGALLPAILDAELDRAVGRSANGLEILDLAGGQRLASIPRSALTHAATHLAFAPDGARLAVSDGHRISIFSTTTGALERSWDAGTVLAMAWRQDGGALLTGATRPLPERVWDPARGVLAPTQLEPELVERLAHADLDPSWRWAFEGDDVILRVLDGLALVLEPHGEVTETGLYDSGEPESLRVRVGGLDSSRVPTLDQLPARLRHRGLLDDFLAGKPLPRPQLSEAELAALAPEP